MLGQLNIQGQVDDNTLTQVVSDVRNNPGIDARPGLEILYEFVRGAISQGLNDKAIIYLWHADQNTLDLNSWIQLYFRGIRTKTELSYVAKRYRIPDQLLDDLIDSRRALIPFRTIPSMVSSGVITQTYAISQLQAHGYTLADANALLAYALGKTVKTKVQSAQKTHAVSVATAKQFWEHGALTDEQYSAILTEHGYDASHVALTIKLEKAQLALQERKDYATAIVDQALAGLLSYDQAVTQLTSANYTPAEISKYTRKLITAKRVQTKLPSEAELHTFFSTKIIDADTYKSALASIGFS